MPRYRWDSPETTPTHLAEFGIDVEPGQEFETEAEVNHPYAVRLDAEKPKKEK